MYVREHCIKTTLVNIQLSSCISKYMDTHTRTHAHTHTVLVCTYLEVSLQLCHPLLSNSPDLAPSKEDLAW